VKRTLLVIALLAAASSVRADPDKDRQAKEAADAGAALFGKNDFAGAAGKFVEAYAANRDPSYLFNAAQAYRHGGDCIRAADFYGRFLSEVPHPPNEDKIRVWYASQMQCAKEKSKGIELQKPDESPASADELTQPAAPTPTQPTPTQPTMEQPRPSNHRGLAIALAGTGVAALAVGGFFAWDASYLSDQRASYLAGCVASPCPSSVVNDYDRRGSRAQTISIVGFAAGGLALAASATLFVMARSETRSVAIEPTPGGAVISAHWQLD
jgi:hypothetical protein